MWFRLALSLGMSVKRAKQEIDSHEFGYWMAYYGLEPWGERVADMRHGIAVATLANINRNTEARPEPYSPTDFIPWLETNRQEPTETGPVLLDEPGAQTRLIKATIFGCQPE